MAPTNQEKHEEAYRAAAEAVRSGEPALLAERAGVQWHPGPDARSGAMVIPSLGSAAELSWPELVFQSRSPLLMSFPWRLIALHYLAGATGQEPDGDWISYRELPDGLFYANTVTREVEEPLATLFGRAADDFQAAGRPMGAEVDDVADSSLVLRPLPRVAMLFALWLADEEFPAKVKVLYDRVGAQYLPLQDLRILADLLGAALKSRALRGDEASDRPSEARPER
jgi:hypothetical protein